MNSPETKPSLLARRPWLLVLFAFILLLGAWSALITIAVKNAPQQIKLPTARSGPPPAAPGH